MLPNAPINGTLLDAVNVKNDKIPNINVTTIVNIIPNECYFLYKK